jgi:hypothetical protein
VYVVDFRRDNEKTIHVDNDNAFMTAEDVGIAEEWLKVV